MRHFNFLNSLFHDDCFLIRINNNYLSLVSINVFNPSLKVLTAVSI